MGNSAFRPKIDHLFHLISLLLDNASPSARDVSRVTGAVISMEFALGPIIHFAPEICTPSSIVHAYSLSCKVALSRQALEELKFWQDNFSRLCGETHLETVSKDRTFDLF